MMPIIYMCMQMVQEGHMLNVLCLDQIFLKHTNTSQRERLQLVRYIILEHTVMTGHRHQQCYDKRSLQVQHVNTNRSVINLNNHKNTL